MKKLKKGKIIILIVLLILIIFELVAFRNSRAEKIIPINATFTDTAEKVSVITETIDAKSEAESGYTVILPDMVNNKKVNKYFVTPKTINETTGSNGTLENVEKIEMLPGDKIYLTDEELELKKLDLSIEYDKKDDLYNQKLIANSDKFNIEVEGYFPLDANLIIETTGKEALNNDIDKFLYTTTFDAAYKVFIQQNGKEFKPTDDIKITFKSNETETITDNTYKIVNADSTGNNLTEITDFTIEQNKIYFNTSSLGIFAILKNIEIQSGANANSLATPTIQGRTTVTNRGIMEDVWDGTSSSAFKYGNGTETEPYLITNSAELSYLATQVNNGIAYENTFFQLAMNLNLDNKNWTPIGNTNNPFKGTFDGAGHYISNMNITINSIPTNSIENYGLFGTIGDSSNRTLINNIELRNSTILLNSNGTTANNNTDKGWHIGSIVGTMYNNSTVQNCIVKNMNITGGNGVTLRTNYTQLAIGGIAGYATNNANSTTDPGDNRRYLISNCYVKGNINIEANRYESGGWFNTTYTGEAQYHAGGIIGTIRSQPVWPTNCLYNGRIDSNGFIGPIFAAVMNRTSFTNTGNYGTLWNGNDAGNLTMNSYYINFYANGTGFTSNEQSGDSSSYIADDSSWWNEPEDLEYAQGVNKGLYTNEESSMLNTFNANAQGNIHWEYSGGEFNLRPRFEAYVDSSAQPTYKVIVNNSYTSGPYTYTWYLDGNIITNLQNQTQVTQEQVFDRDFLYDVVIFDGKYYYVAQIKIERLSLYIEFTEDIANGTITGNLAGNALPYINLNDYTYRWYILDVTGEHRDIIEGATDKTLENLEDGAEYELVATNNTISSLTVSGRYNLADRTVVYCDYRNGNDRRNDGFSPDRPVKTLSTAYEKLKEDGTRSSNIIVIMGTYSSNSIYNYKEGNSSDDTYAKKATLTGKYNGIDYNAELYFYSGSGTYRYMAEDTTFQNMIFYGNRDQMYFYLQGYSLTIGEDVTMQNYATSNTNQGLLGGNAPAFHIFCGWNQYNYSTLPRKDAEVIIKSGTYGRIVGGGSPGTSSGQGQQISHDFMGSSKSDSFNITITIDIQNSTTSNQYDYDVNLLTGGSAAGNNYSNVVQNIKNGSVGRLIGGSIGDSAYRPRNWNYPENTFLGTATINVTGGSVDELYGGCLGRNMDVVGSSYASGNTCDSYFYGTVNINISGGRIESNIYGAGAGGVTGYSQNSSDPYKNYGQEFDTSVAINITGGTIEGDIFGGGYGYTEYLNQNVTAVDGGTLYGDSTINISESPVINGNVYASGCGYNYRNKQEIAQMEGNSIVNISGTPDINGIIFGAGNGVSGYNEMAKLIGTSTININTDLDTEVYGGGNIAKVEGNTNINIINGTHTSAIYGGGNVGEIQGNSTVNINDGIQTLVYGGGNQAKVTTSTININNGTNTDVFAGGNSADLETTNVFVMGGNTTNLYGGSNQRGNINSSNITSTAGTVTTMYGGNNIGGNTANAKITINGGIITETLYGGGNQVDTTKTEIYLINCGNKIPNVFGAGNNAGANETHIYEQGGLVENVYGGANQAGNVPVTEIIMDSGTFDTIYGGNNMGGTNDVSNVTINSGSINKAIYGGGNQVTTNTSNVTVNNVLGQIPEVYGGGYSANVITSNVKVNNGNIDYVFGGSNTKGTVATSNVHIYDGHINEVYGGNNAGGNTITANITVHENGSVANVYGGGNEAITTETRVIINGTITECVYGGGNKAGVDTSTDVLVEGAHVVNNVYGGGNEGSVTENTNVHIKNSKLDNSVYGGGNGVTAIVQGNTILTIDGTTTQIENHAFGGGNQANTGEENVNNSSSTVNIAGGEIGGNVYGGANTAVVYGTTTTAIGYDALTNNNLEQGDIHIVGTVFGGGEANASGSPIYDFSFISVTKGIEIYLNGNSYNVINIDGSIFGSGNASSTSGTSIIDIKDYGTIQNPKYNVSIQRANTCTISNSAIALDGATDRTNEYADTYYSLSRVDNIKLKNNSTLYLNYGANLLRQFDSLVDVNGQEEKGTVTIDENGNTVKNVDNRIYMAEGKNLDVATNEGLTAFGKVNGMTFFGIYTNTIVPASSTGIYGSNFNNGDAITIPDMFTLSSYVRAEHKRDPEHDIKVDGFYTNYDNDGTIKVDYVGVTPAEDVYYIWNVGKTGEITRFDVSLIASKYATFGTDELSLVGFSDPNIKFSIDNVTSGFRNNEILLDPDEVPSIAETEDDANKMFGLTMEAGNNGWSNPSETTFLAQNGNTSYTGDSMYDSDNSAYTPSLYFCLYHAQNISGERTIGSVTINMTALVPVDEQNILPKRIMIVVTITSKEYQDDYIEAAITPGDQFNLFTSTETVITNKSSFSTYYSLYVNEFSSTDYARDYNNYERVLISNASDGSPYMLPEGTNITMLDMVTNEYYYYIVNADDVRNNKYIYHLSDFTYMGSTDRKYSESEMGNIYYDKDQDLIYENYIFQFNFKDTNLNTDLVNNTMLMELRNKDDETILGVLGIHRDVMRYSVYQNRDSTIGLNATVDPVNYLGNDIGLDVSTEFTQQVLDSRVIFDTQYFDKKMGIKLTFFDANGNALQNDSLLGIYFTLDGVNYYPRIDGTTRIKIADKVSNILSNITINTSNNTTLATGDYTIRIETYGSPDGIYYGLNSSDSIEVDLTIINSIYGIKITTPDEYKIIQKDTGLNQNNQNLLKGNVEYSSGLSQPIITVSLERRKYDSVYDQNYEVVDLANYVTDSLTKFNFENENSDKLEYLFSDKPTANMDFTYAIKQNLTTGTYRLTFKLYDVKNIDNQNRYEFIGDAYEYIIIK